MGTREVTQPPQSSAWRVSRRDSLGVASTGLQAPVSRQHLHPTSLQALSPTLIQRRERQAQEPEREGTKEAQRRSFW